MADKRNNKNESEYLKLQLKISKAIEKQTKNLSSWQEAQESIVENAKLIKILEEEIAQASGDRKDELEKQRKQLVETNKELIKTKNLFKAVGNSLTQGFKGLIPSLNNVFSKLLEIDDVIRDSSISIGITGQRFKTFESAAESAESKVVDLGFELGENVKMMTDFANATGRQVILSQSSQENMMEVARATGLSLENMGTLTGDMEAFGLGSIQAANTIMGIRDMSEKMGVNSGKVIKKFEQNLGLLNKLDFKGGVKGMAKMAAYSEKFKLSMESVASVSDKVFRPEGAIEAAATLQTLGGSLSQLGDPFQLMYEARYAPEELAKSLTESAKASAVFNKETGEFEVNALELDRLREAAGALGMDYTELVKTAKQASKIDYLEKFLPSGMDQTDKDILIGMTEMSDKGAEITFVDEDNNVKTKLLSDLGDKEKERLVQMAKEREQIEEQAMSLKKEWQAIQNSMLIVGVKIFRPLVKWMNEDGKQLLVGIKDFIIGLGKGITRLYNFLGPKGSFIVALSALFLSKFGKLAWWFAKGKALGMGFNSVTTKGKRGLIGKIKDKLGGMFSKSKGGGASDMVTAKNGSKWGKNSPQGKMIRTKGGTQPLGKQSGSMSKMKPKKLSKIGSSAGGAAKGLLAFGAALLMVGGAIYLAATGLSKLTQSFSELTGPQALGALGAIVAVMGGFVAIIYAMVPAIATLGAVSTPVAIPLLALGAAFLMIGGAIWLAATGISTLVDSFTNMFSVIGDQGSNLFLAGTGFITMAAGIGLLTISLIALGAASLLALPGLMIMGATTAMIVDTAESLSNVGGSGGIKESIDAINSVDQSKIDSLKELASMMSFWGMFGGNVVTVEFGDLKVKGDVDLRGEGGGKSNTEWVEDPMFVRKLKSLIMETMESDRKGGR